MTDNHVLILDAGNTVLKAARFSGGRLAHLSILPYSPQPSFEQALRHEAEQRPQAVILSSVANLRKEHVQPFFDAEVLDFNAQTPMPLEIDYDTPTTVGADRLANACGGQKLVGEVDQLIIDIGTCITCDLVEGGKRFKGGSISPGIRLRSQGMHQFTARLPEVELDPEVPLTGTSTQTSLQSGIYYGILDELRGRIERTRKKYPELRVVLTGGDFVYFEKGLECPIFAHPKLTLVGLHEILSYHMEKR